MASYDTIVVGLGVSGLTALATLAKAGQTVLGLEAADRVGGRVCTVPFADGVVELGAEWIHGTEDSRVYELAAGNSISLLPQETFFESYRSDGAGTDQALVNELIELCLEMTQHPPAQPEPLGDFVTRECRAYIARRHAHLLEDEDFVPEFLRFMSLFVNNYEASDDWRDVTTGSHYAELAGHQHLSWHRAGYSTLLDIILNKHNDGPGLPTARTELGRHVTRVRCPAQARDPVTVECEDGAVYTARSVIVTVSLGVLKERHASLFSPPLPPQKVEAIETMTMGVMDKVILSFDRAWWPRHATFFGFIWRAADRRRMAEDERWATTIFGASAPRGAAKALTLWTSGEAGKLVECLPEEVVKRKCWQLLQRFMGGSVTVPEPTGIIRSTWHSNPLTRGSYTYDGLWRSRLPGARARLAAPVSDDTGRPRLLFAGEATNGVHYSTVHGAMETGLREANRLLNVKSKI